jgi:hypothetical protein
MIPNFKEILSELSYRVDGGIPDLNKESHVNHLINILRENGISDAAPLAQKARVYFSYLNEATPKKGDAGLEAAAEKFKSKTYKNSKGGEVSFTTAINYGYKGKDNDSAHIQAMNDLETFIGDSGGKYGTMEKPKQPDEPSQNIFGKDKGGKVFEPETPAVQQPQAADLNKVKKVTSDIYGAKKGTIMGGINEGDNKVKSDMLTYGYNGYQKATGKKPAPGGAGSAFNEILSCESAKILQKYPDLNEEELTRVLIS